MALGGIATGSKNVQDVANVVPTMRYKRWMTMAEAKLPITGSSSEAIAG